VAEAIRLIIWDLDDTFWRGTLTEGGIAYQRHIHDIVIALARRGIISTICSKNDLAPVRDILQAHGLWDYFVMPSINWEPKGQRIAALAEAFQLRPPTILFIDDNDMNRNEALHYVPDLQVASEAVIDGLLEDARCRGKDDSGLTRLAQYRLLAQRQAAQTASGDNLAFLRQSGIRVTFEHDVLAHAERAIELINRTNQLNFTKRRLPDDPAAARAALAAMVREFDVQCALIRVTDRYGDYGFCGFYLTRGSLRGRQLQHFCFSCRILNMGVEAWVYAQLGRPGLVVAGEVIGTVESPEPIDWISFGPAVAADAAAAAATTTTTTTTRELGDVFIHGGCDLAAVSHYFGMVSRRVSGAFNAVRGGVDLRFDHSQFLAYAAAGLDAPQRAAAALLGYQATDFDASLWQDAAGAGLWLLSLWADAHFLLYRHGETGLTLPFTVPVHVPGTGHADLTRIDAASLGERVTQSWVGEALGHLQRAFTCVGLTPQPLFQANLRRLLAAAPADALVFILGANEQEMPQARFVGPKVQAHRALNRWTAEVCQEFAQARLINIRDFVRDESEVLNLNHFDRMVYYRIYEHVLAAIRQHRAPAAASLAHSAAA
jgi:FkbH-like protein